jgi:uncharacterized membrane protein
MKLIIKKTNDERWDFVADALKGETGVITATEIRNGIVHYNANFPVYGGLFVGIPASVVEVVE